MLSPGGQQGLRCKAIVRLKGRLLLTQFTPKLLIFFKYNYSAELTQNDYTYHRPHLASHSYSLPNLATDPIFLSIYSLVCTCQISMVSNVSFFSFPFEILSFPECNKSHSLFL